jgi:predicted ATPase with chaperone activity
MSRAEVLSADANASWRSPSPNLDSRREDATAQGKVGRTIADLTGEDGLNPKHLSEAVQYRTLDRNLWA